MPALLDDEDFSDFKLERYNPWKHGHSKVKFGIRDKFYISFNFDKYEIETSKYHAGWCIKTNRLSVWHKHVPDEFSFYFYKDAIVDLIKEFDPTLFFQEIEDSTVKPEDVVILYTSEEFIHDKIEKLKKLMIFI